MGNFLLRDVSGILRSMFFVFRSYFCRNVFPNSIILRSRSSFLLSEIFFELYFRSCSAMFLNPFDHVFCFVTVLRLTSDLPHSLFQLH